MKGKGGRNEGVKEATQEEGSKGRKEGKSCHVETGTAEKEAKIEGRK